MDLGFRLADVRGLEREHVDYRGDKDPWINLRKCGATEEECEFLVRREHQTWGKWVGDRVELNAMTSDQFIAWLEVKLVEVEAGVRKVVPSPSTLAKAYRRAVQRRRAQAAIDEALSQFDPDEETPIPDDLETTLREKLDGSTKSWDQVLWDLVDDDEDDGEAPRDDEEDA